MSSPAAANVVMPPVQGSWAHDAENAVATSWPLRKRRHRTRRQPEEPAAPATTVALGIPAPAREHKTGLPGQELCKLGPTANYHAEHEAADRAPGSAAVVEGHLVAVGVGEREGAAERTVDGR
jgi:hypothetical protein